MILCIVESTRAYRDNVAILMTHMVMAMQVYINANTDSLKWKNQELAGVYGEREKK